jgi:hypothetical protein
LRRPHLRTIAALARTAFASAVVVVTSLSVVACDTDHVKLQAGECVDASARVVDCGDGAAAHQVVEVMRTEGAYPSCPPPLLATMFTEGGDGPMIGVAICLGPIAGPGSS